jgi:HAD superfamily hydrolase (TIGR01509 family)
MLRVVRPEVDAVTIDAYGTLVRLVDPVPELTEALRRHGVEQTDEQVEAAFDAEVDYYVQRSHEGRDEAALALLRRDCAAVFLGAAGAEVEPEAFVDDFIAALRFEPLPAAFETCNELAGRGYRLAVVSNWDVGLRGQLAQLGLDVPVVTSAEAGAPKPDPAIFRLALARLEVEPARALHVGDSDADEEGARAAGMRFRPAPLADAVRELL